MLRRTFLGSLTAAAQAPPPTILVHEHVMVDFIGAAGVSPSRYNRADVIRVAKPHLEAIKKLGCVRLQECTPNYIGRDAGLMQELQEQTGLEIWTNTGLYAAANFKYLPDFARTMTAEQLARLWIAEAEKGIDGVKPRFIKIGVDKGPLPELSRKIVKAGAIAGRETGLTVCAHTGDGAAAVEELEILTSNGLPAERFVWVHAHSERNHAFHEQVGRAGAWVEFDGVAPNSIAWHVECVEFMESKQLLNRTLISQDAGWYNVGEPEGGRFRPYTSVYTHFIPKLRAGWAEEIFLKNPRAAFPSTSGIGSQRDRRV